MRHTYQLLAISALAITVLSACDDSGFDMPEQIDSMVPIRFAANSGLTARDELLNTSDLSLFNVYAYNSATQEKIMNNFSVAKDNAGNWKYDYTQFWPTQGADFYAYAPAGWVSDNNPLTPTAFDNSRAISDLLYATAISQNGIADARKQTVMLDFKHALAKCTFSIAAENQDLTISLSKVSITNIASNADFTFPVASTRASSSNADRVGSWSNLSIPKEYVIFNAGRDKDRISLGNRAIELSRLRNDVPQFMIPQGLRFENGGVDGDNAIVIVCSIYDKNSGVKLWPNAETEPENMVNGNVGGDGIIRIPLMSEDFDQWRGGYEYNYRIELSANPGKGRSVGATISATARTSITTEA